MEKIIKKRKPSTKREEIDNIDIIQALFRHNGILSPVAKEIGVAYSTLRNWIAEDPELKKAQWDSKERFTDFVESQLYKNIAEGKEISIFFYLKTQAKHRGYVEKQEVAHSGELKADIKYYLPTLKKAK